MSKGVLQLTTWYILPLVVCPVLYRMYDVLSHYWLNFTIPYFATFYFAGDDNLEPGTQRQYSITDFELIRVIGRGSYAKVLMVELKKTKRIYAMKVIKKALVTDDEVRKNKKLAIGSYTFYVGTRVSYRVEKLQSVELLLVHAN